MTVYRKILVLFCMMTVALQGFAQFPFETKFDFSYFMPQEKFNYRSDIPTPKQFFGFELGEHHLSYDQVFAYMQMLAQKSPRITSEIPALRTFQQRSLIFLTVTSPENHANIEKIRTEHLKLSDPAQSGSVNINSMPVVVWLGYGVHGNEASGPHASLAVAYFLAAAEGPEIDDILKNSVILIQPSLNPDGFHRFSTWVNANRSFTPVTDPNSREFRETNPGSRGNQYGFDMNRDWLPLQMPESRSRMGFYFKWRPTMVNDYHEHGTSANYYFSPGEPKRTHPLIPSTNFEVTRQIAQFHGKELDKINTIYFARENFDDIYPGKGGCFPDFLGAIGILYEQPSSRGHFQERNDGLVRTFPSAIRNQAYCSYSAIRAGIAMRTQLLDYTRNSYREAQRMATADPIQGYVFGSPHTKQIDSEFFKLLNQLEIEVYRLNRPVTAAGRSFETEHSYFIPSRQNDYRLLKTIMERRFEFPDTISYDVWAWTQPLAYNLHYAELNNVSGLMGARLTEFPAMKGNVIGKSDYAYLFDVDEFYSPKLIYHLQEAGVRLKSAAQPFRTHINGKEHSFDFGAVMIPVADQFRSSEEIYALLQRWAPEAGVTVHPVFSSFAVELDLGGRNFRDMQLPKMAIIYGAGGSFGSVGTVWHLFDQRLKIPLTLLEHDRISPSVLARYNTIILTGNYNFSKEADEQLKAWHAAGGRIIAIGEAWRTVNRIGIANIELKETAAQANRATSGAQVYLAHIDRPPFRRGNRIAGIILENRLDRSSPIAYGIKSNTIPTFKESGNFFKSPTPYSAPVSYLEKPLMSGYIPTDLLNQVANTPSVLVFQRLVYFADEPVYRYHWFGTTRLFLNAIFFPL
ncbi:MAG: peptidase M14 [Bacteroidales bacterium]|jgi:hypothetical protein|nr:peptidase M14 [Bacteroidales bacterium]